MASATTEILILGGGPAGAAAGRLLAAWGHRVRLITRPPAADGLAVSLPPSCEKLFDTIGVGAAIDRAGFIRSTGNTVWWGSRQPRQETFAGGARGWQVDLNQFAELLLREAMAAGVTVERSIVSEIGAGPDAAFLLDCTGRSGLIGRRNDLRQYDDGPRTVALAATWRHQRSWPIPDDTHTLVESYEDGWMWSVPTGQGVRHVAAMVDPQRSALARGAPAREVYLAQIAKTREFKRILEGASLAAGPWGWDASTYRAREYAGANWLLVGDAGSFIDPLSSAGVKKALASGWLAAIVANTCLARPSMRTPALEFFSAREREIERHHAEASRVFLSAAAQDHRHAFWADRFDPPHRDGDADRVRLAFDRLKAADAFDVAVGGGVRLEPRACIEGRQITLAPHIVTADHPDGTRYLHDIDMLTVLELAPGVSQVPDLFEQYSRRHPGAPLHDFLLALATAVSRGWLVAE